MVLAAVLPAPGQSVQVIETYASVDSNTTYQQMDGVGASLTDSAGWILWNKLAESQRMH